ncbi:MAG: hypothetical protein K2N63_12110 [Lachnospiraceae bacterium]|nr:hypothetical protein [Lachnospiraceae bacterium]
MGSSCRKRGKGYLVLGVGTILLSGALMFCACGKQEQGESNTGLQQGDLGESGENLSGSNMGMDGSIKDGTGDNMAGVTQPLDKEDEVITANGVGKEEISEGGMNLLQKLEKRYEWTREGSFILDGFDEEEKAVAKQVQEVSGKTACWMIRRDFDGDGRKEAFVYASDLEKEDGLELWFAAADGTVGQLNGLEEANNFGDHGCIELPGMIFYVCRIEGAHRTNYFMYEVDGNMAKPAPIHCLDGVKAAGDGRLCISVYMDDQYSRIGHYGEEGLICKTMKDYYYFYDKDGFHEYSGVPVTEEEFSQYENGFEILSAIRKSGGIVKDIYYFADGRMIVNYIGGEDAETELMKNIKNNHYLQVPILSAGEDGFVLAWESSDIRLMQQQQYEGERGEHDLFVGDGIYRPFNQEELAQYPVYQSPFEYYKEAYSGMTKEDLKICTIKNLDVPEPEQNKILATGADLSGISRRNLLFRFNEEFQEAVIGEENSGNYAGALLGLAPYEKSLGIWIGDTLILKGALQDYLSSGTIGFCAVSTDSRGESSIYADCLVFSDNVDARRAGIFTVGAAVKIHAFAEAVGLVKEDYAERILTVGTYQKEQEYLVDLNGDQVEESLFVGQNLLLVNGENYSGFLDGCEEPDMNSFYIWDIDQSDGILELGILDHGANGNEFTWLFWYDGETLHSAGSVEGAWDEQGRWIAMDGKGTLVTNGRLSVLQTWSAKKTFCLDGTHNLVEQEPLLYYPVSSSEEKYPYTLLGPVRLYEAMDVTSDSVVIKEGVKITFPATDNKQFVMVETEDGVQGYLYLENGTRIEMPEGGYYEWSSDVIEGLNHAG